MTNKGRKLGPHRGGKGMKVCWRNVGHHHWVAVGVHLQGQRLLALGRIVLPVLFAVGVGPLGAEGWAGFHFQVAA